MAKSKKSNTESTAAAVERKIGFKGHRQGLQARGEALTFTSRPSGQLYQLEEWLNNDRKYTYRKVYDDGRVITFVEQQTDDFRNTDGQ